MQAIVFQQGRATVREVPEPIPAAGEVLIQVSLAGICGTDLQLLQGYANFEGIPGHEFVGKVVRGPAQLQGKRVVGEINCVCGRCDMCSSGLSNHCRRRTVVGIVNRPGAFAEYICLPERNCHLVPDSVSNEEAVFTEPLAAAYQIRWQVKIEPRMNIAVLGTGRLGLLIAQVLARTGCKLIAIGRNQKTLDFLDRKGIRTAQVQQLQRTADHDVVVECTGSPDGLTTALELVRPRGTIVMKTTTQAKSTADLTPLVVNEITLVGCRCGTFGEALSALARKEIDVLGMISRQMPLADGVKALEASAQSDNIKILLQVTR